MFALIALVVAAIGTYAVLAYSVTRRTREFGLRMALGADRAGLLRLVVREGMTVSAAGVGLGVAAALALTRLLSALVFGVSVNDPGTLVAVPLLLILVAALACVVPALRASRTNPMTALKLD